MFDPRSTCKVNFFPNAGVSREVSRRSPTAQAPRQILASTHARTRNIPLLEIPSMIDVDDCIPCSFFQAPSSFVSCTPSFWSCSYRWLCAIEYDCEVVSQCRARKRVNCQLNSYHTYRCHLGRPARTRRVFAVVSTLLIYVPSLTNLHK